jgi:hypothetical protein
VQVRYDRHVTSFTHLFILRMNSARSLGTARNKRFNSAKKFTAQIFKATCNYQHVVLIQREFDQVIHVFISFSVSLPASWGINQSLHVSNRTALFGEMSSLAARTSQFNTAP